MEHRPRDHDLRAYLDTEMHARPADELQVPLRASYLAQFADAEDRGAGHQHLAELLQRFGVSPPDPSANHFSCDLGAFRLRWERHTEYFRYTFVVAGLVDGSGAATPALAAVPGEWLATMPGRTLVALHATLLAIDEDRIDLDALSGEHFSDSVVIGSSILGGAAIVLTDLRIHDDGFSRWLVVDQGMSPRQAGRNLQNLFEMDTYRTLALLALPVARELAPDLGRYEQELSEVTSALAQATADEPLLLERLTRLEAHIESLESRHLYRFEAAAAYNDLVQRRLRDLRETRLRGGLLTLQEFIDRRLAPAMNTCRSVASRLESLSQRVARANQMLATRVDISRERQNQQLLASLNRRAQLQLRLQRTVEGLSIAAVTYYIVGLVGYAAKGISAAGIPVSSEIAMAVAIPIVAMIAAAGIRRTLRLAEGQDIKEP